MTNTTDPLPVTAPAHSRPTHERSPLAAPRFESLDVVRGVALCGILFVDAPPLLAMGGWTETMEPTNPVRLVLDLTAQQRFFPLFALLFGLGFGLMWRSAQRAAHPRRVMARRLGALAVVGLAHQFFQPGEVLLPYALCGLVLTLPLTYAPRWVALAAGAAAVPIALILGGGLSLIPALIVLGFGLARYDVVAAEQQETIVVAMLAAASSALAIVTVAWQYRTMGSGADNVPSAVAGFFMAGAYLTIILLLLRTPVRSVLVRVFTPLGRTALTNYLAATALLVFIRPWTAQLGLVDTTAGWLRMLAFCVLVLVVQQWISRWWLNRFGQGPLEAGWRWITWWGPRPTATASVAGSR